MAKRILFAINGYGFGNSTRVHGILDHLNTKTSVDILASGNSFVYFKDKKNLYDQLFRQNSVSYKVNRHGEIDFVRTFVSPLMISNLAENLKWLFQNIRKYDLLVVDSDYLSAVVAKIFQVKVVSINGAVQNFKDLEIKNFLSCLNQGLFELLDLGFQKVIPDLTLVPSFDCAVDFLKKKFLAVPPIVRQGIVARSSFTNLPKRGLVMLSGSDLSDDREIRTIVEQNPKIHFTWVGGPKNLKARNLKLQKRSVNTIRLINEADFVICNAGFSSISEVLMAQKPAVFLPIRGHFEQQANAQWIQKNRLGCIIQSHEPIPLQAFIRQFGQFQTRIQSFNFSHNGSRVASEVIWGQL